MRTTHIKYSPVGSLFRAESRWQPPPQLAKSTMQSGTRSCDQIFEQNCTPLIGRGLGFEKETHENRQGIMNARGVNRFPGGCDG